MSISLTKTGNKLRIQGLSGFLLTLVISGLLVSCKADIKKSYWENGNPKSVLQYKDGNLDGLCSWYYENGNTQHQANYQYNKLHGKSLQFFESGMVSMEGWYLNNLKDSIFTYYNQQGKIIAVENYRSNNLHGPMKKYYEIGNIMIEGYYKNNMMDSIWLFYAGSGEIIGKADFIDGTGTQKSWYQNGKLQRVIRYENNLKHGNEEFYDAEGRLESIKKHEKGLPDSD